MISVLGSGDSIAPMIDDELKIKEQIKVVLVDSIALGINNIMKNKRANQGSIVAILNCMGSVY